MIELTAIATILSFVAILVLVFFFKNGYNLPQLMLFIVIAVSNAGYLALNTSQSLEAAILANKITYLGGLFLPFFILASVADICKIKIPDFIQIIIISINTILFGFVAMSDHNDYFYKDITFYVKDGVANISKTYGPMHTVFVMMLYGQTLACVLLVAWTIWKKKNVPIKTAWIILFTILFSMSIDVVERITHSKLNLMAYAYMIGEYIFFFLCRRMKMYDVSASVMSTLEHVQKYGYITFDRKFRFMGCNDYAYTLYPELRECRVDREINDPELPVYMDIITWVERWDGEENEEKMLQINDRYIKCTIKNLTYGTGRRIEGYLIELMDDTDRQSYVNLINEVNKDLKEQRELAVKLSKDAMSASQAKSDFLASMSHEIRTPINSVIGMNTMILREAQNPNIIDYAKDISGSANYLLGLINDILDFSKIESGKMEILPVEYDLYKMLNSIHTMIGVRAMEKSLVFKITADPSLPKRLFGDEVRVRQVIINLLTNAVKYTEKGEVTLEIVPGEKDGVFCLSIKVKDTGIGIKQENIDKLFDSFQRLDSVRNRNVEGTGLGLAITRNLTELMGGEIGVESVYGQGSVFYTVLPQKVIGDEKIGEFKPGLHMTEDVDDIGGNLVYAPKARILVVDDVKMNLKVMKGLLKNTGVNITTALSGEECINLMKKEDFDIVFMDDMMPSLTGGETFEILKKEGLAERQPVIMLTANAVSGAMEEYLSKGFSDYLAKPVRPAELEKMIGKYLDSELLEEPPVKNDDGAETGKKGPDYLDMDIAMEFCMNDMDMFNDVAMAFIDEDRREELGQLYRDKNWKDYRIMVHALKSNSKTIGAVHMFEEAKTIEEHLKNNDIEYAIANHDTLIAHYTELLEQMRESFGT
ncbi:MAG: response regulator [Lachnospiraceae bacterium]|nr:response regulator [Lachnospiraceae bacterium]